ncbi:hypothetical protein CK228_24340 [Mesorhizobium sp. WSM4312]|nr:hypothetical protein CK228_24340 [Mesorhizobium sp. WSM4312]
MAGLLADVCETAGSSRLSQPRRGQEQGSRLLSMRMSDLAEVDLGRGQIIARLRAPALMSMDATEPVAQTCATTVLTGLHPLGACAI